MPSSAESAELPAQLAAHGATQRTSTKVSLDPEPPPEAGQASGLLTALGHGPADKRLEVLREIGRGGSISQAARSVGVSYKAAWQALDTLTNLAGVALVQRSVGGAGGGGARLTQAGHDLLAAAAAMQQARHAVAGQMQVARQELARSGQEARQVLSAVQGLGVRTSMRNQWPCVVQSLEQAGPLVRVHLKPAAQEEAAAAASPPWLVVARITRESAQLLGLAPGVVVQVLCKATAVQVVPRAGQSAPLGADQSEQAMALNAWPAVVTRVARGALGDEVTAALPGGIHMVGFAAPHCGMRARARVWMQVPEAGVVLSL